MARMRHPNIVAFIGVCVVPPCVLTGKCDRVLTRIAAGFQHGSRTDLGLGFVRHFPLGQLFAILAARLLLCV